MKDFDKDPLTGDPIPKSNKREDETRPQKSPPDIDLANLEGMTREELITLVRRVCGARWAEIITMTRAEQAIAMKDRLAHIALTAEVKEALNAIDKFLDREEGRARQQIELTGKDGSPLSVRLLAIQERYLPKDITPPLIEN
ncbi:MAG TPA: hypothetical protein VK890_03345 [Bacteroidia bacterium]|jgi:hypothetical protein|nr:hypothetical protein [Bacteroidia bacterium]